MPPWTHFQPLAQLTKLQSLNTFSVAPVINVSGSPCCQDCLSLVTFQSLLYFVRPWVNSPLKEASELKLIFAFWWFSGQSLWCVCPIFQSVYWMKLMEVPLIQLLMFSCLGGFQREPRPREPVSPVRSSLPHHGCILFIIQPMNPHSSPREVWSR